MNGSSLREIQGLALRHALEDVDEDDVAELPLDGVLGDGDADIASPATSSGSHYGFAMFWMMAVPNSEHFTSLAPSIKRAKS